MATEVTNGLNLNKTAIEQALLHPVSSDPSSPSESQVWYNTTTDRVMIRSNGSNESLAFLDDVTSGSITGSLWNAQSVILAVSDNSPVAQIVGVNQVVGRISGGDIGALTAAQLRTIIGVESGATADQTASQIKTAYESNAQTNAFTDALLTKLNGIEANAATDQSAAQLLSAVKTVDGSGSGLDADTVDGVQASSLALVTYVDAQISSAISGVVNGAGAAYDTLSELATELQSNDGDITTILSAQAGKTDKYAANIGNGSLTSIAVTHNLGSSDVVMSCRTVSTNAAVIVDWVATSANVITLTFSSAPSTNQFRVTVIG